MVRAGNQKVRCREQPATLRIAAGGKLFQRVSGIGDNREPCIDDPLCHVCERSGLGKGLPTGERDAVDPVRCKNAGCELFSGNDLCGREGP